MKRVNAIMVLLLALVLLAGCTRARPMEDLTVVLVLGIDPGKTPNTVRVTTGFPVFSKEAKEKTHRATAEGKGTRDALQNIAAVIEKEIALGQMRVVVVGEELAKNGRISEDLDLLSRDPTFPLNAYVLVTKGTAKDLVDLRPPTNERVGLYLQDMVRSGKGQGILPDRNIQDFYVRLNAQGWDPYLGYIEKEENNIKNLGTALFRDTKMVGSLNRLETSLFLALNEEEQGSIGSFEDPIDRAKQITLSLAESNRKVKTGIADGNPVIDIEFEVEADVINKEAENERLIEPEVIRQYEKSLAKQVNTEMEKLLHKLQSLNSDPLGLGAYLRMQNYGYWKQIGDKGWRERYPAAQINIKTTFKIRRFGVTTI